jgi:SAM-dependent methyltransferase
MINVDVCPLCGGSDFRPFEVAGSNGLEVTYLICGWCGLVFQSPRMGDEALSSFYEAQYRRDMQGVEGPCEKDLHSQVARARTLVRLLEKAVPEVARHLDIGSSSGALMAVFAERYHCAMVGVEPGMAYRAFSRARGMNVYPALGRLAAANEGPFELITMSHVLEHLPEPVEYLAQLRSHYLAPDGHLLLEVPNLYEHHSLEPTHLIAYSARTLRETLRKAGFEVVLLRVHGGFRSAFLRLYVTALARPRGIVRKYLVRRTSPSTERLKRSLGMAFHRLGSKIAPSLAWRQPRGDETHWPILSAVLFVISALSSGEILGLVEGSCAGAV